MKLNCSRPGWSLRKETVAGLCGLPQPKPPEDCTQLFYPTLPASAAFNRSFQRKAVAGNPRAKDGTIVSKGEEGHT